MSSACSNPVLYGYLNDNFKKEFRQLFLQCTSNSFVDWICHLKGSSSSSSTPSAVQRSLPGSLKQKTARNDIVRDTSSKELDTLNSTSNPQLFHCYSNELSCKNSLLLNSNSILNSSTPILNNSKSNNIHLSTIEQLSEPTSEQTIEQTDQQSTGQTDCCLNNSNHSNLNEKINSLDSNQDSNQDSNLDNNQISNSTSLTREESTINNESTTQENNHNQFRKSNDLNETNHTLYLNFDRNDELNEIKCADYLSRTDAII